MLKKFHDGAANEAYIFAAISRPLLKSDDIEVLKWYRMEKVLQKILSFVMQTQGCNVLCRQQSIPPLQLPTLDSLLGLSLHRGNTW